jgi:hypothetical protein
MVSGAGSSRVIPFEQQSLGDFLSYLGDRTKVMYVPYFQSEDEMSQATTFQSLTSETGHGRESSNTSHAMPS